MTHNDCFFGEACVDGYCGAPVVETGDDASSPGGDGGANSSSPDGGDGADNSGPNNVTTNNVTPNNDASGDMGEGGTDTAGMGPCWADKFGVCMDDEDPDNNAFPGVAFAPMTRGCQSSGFVPLDETISGRQCPLDPEDQYYVTIVECDDDEPGFIVEATLDVKDPCDPADIWFDVEQIGTSCADPNPESDKSLRCETLASGERRISVIWPGSAVPSVGSIRFSIQTPETDDIQFDYDLRIVIREP